MLLIVDWFSRPVIEFRGRGAKQLHSKCKWIEDDNISMENTTHVAFLDTLEASVRRGPANVDPDFVLTGVV